MPLLVGTGSGDAVGPLMRGEMWPWLWPWLWRVGDDGLVWACVCEACLAADANVSERDGAGSGVTARVTACFERAAMAAPGLKARKLAPGSRKDVLSRPRCCCWCCWSCWCC